MTQLNHERCQCIFLCFSIVQKVFDQISFRECVYFIKFEVLMNQCMDWVIAHLKQRLTTVAALNSPLSHQLRKKT